jgi:DNA-binding transcriptional LysR family regulator
LEISQIRYFVALCGALNFTRAARQCRVSQPSLSNGIMALERALGGPLFERAPIALTPLGRRLRPHLEAVLCGIERVHRSASGYRRHKGKRSRTAASGQQALAWWSGSMNTRHGPDALQSPRRS